MFLAKEKALYKTLNMMRLSNQTLIGYFWAPTFESQGVYDIASNAPQACQISEVKDTLIVPPTMFRTTEFSALW